MRKSAAVRLVELQQKGDLPTLLRRELEAGTTQVQIARKWGVSIPTVSRWIDEEGLKRAVVWTDPSRETVAA